MARWRVQIRRRPRPKKLPPRYRLRLSCGHDAIVGAPMPYLGDEVLCSHPHAENRRERVTEIRSV